MRNAIQLILLLILTGCGSKPEFASDNQTVVPCDAPESDPAVKLYVDHFYQKAREYGVSCLRVYSVVTTNEDLSINDNFNVVGVCRTDGHVAVERATIMAGPPILVKALIFHELGHCALGLEHATQDKLNIMTPVLLDLDVIEENWKLLEYKLFNRDLSLTD